MPSEDIKAPGRKSLLTAAAAAVLIAGIVLSYGFIGRAQSKQEVVDWTNTQAMPTVALAGLIPGSSHQTLTLPGNIQPFNRAAIFARVNGYVKSWDQDIGSPVKAGQVLATIDAPDLDQQLGQAKATLASVRANHQIASLTANRNNILLQKQIVAQQLADQTDADAKAKEAVVDANEANVRQLEAMQSFKTLAAPFDGVVTARNVELGMLINSGGSGQPLFEVSDLHRVRIYVQVPQSFTAGLTVGMKATFEMPQYPGAQFEATLSHVSKSINQNSHSMQVELQADNAAGKFFGGSYCNVHFEIPTDANLVKVPSTALITGNQGTHIATLDSNDKVVLRSVQLGRDLGDSVEVVAGLSPADRIINNPPETLAAGDAVRVAQATSQAAAPAPPPPSSKQ
ncbi:MULTISPECIES: efflux RND transporter periplasmic adaptor subunit [unclassified Bradyrhizobium]|uniref:efflux RND transporter periplasmic adaptor subunit n=1 Tax=unclassified Bradyrhizobium TaxID=2631580 RepID=UPI001FF9C47C|nr:MULTISPECIES: efflux RND transporter periplasmic adaptor subunit [unclassified Bradyrhizobium]MCK1291914.1 efflux RND transporter periplasmic adaptor subunit [Bradyrhizobium sp. 30]MCK1349281.1 efflux RND transporter periplasmic adaptor subunit [Bradyrhizobium sp. CW11]MCK1353856.1 efflux RND transporter periplasmic adaptor subunit [Bradyrhizobium sp. CW7]MCK1469844.1 efflux RND transporter periplasmic adaptor subunit [Bradyrhizobium sp. CW10]